MDDDQDEGRSPGSASDPIEEGFERLEFDTIQVIVLLIVARSGNRHIEFV